MSTVIEDFNTIVSAFQIEGELLTAKPFGNGHINDTILSEFKTGTGIVHYIHQKINTSVFPQPEQVIENIALVTAWIREKLVQANADDIDRKTLTLIPARDGSLFYKSSRQGFWRTYSFIEESRCIEKIETANQAFVLGAAVGNFQKMLADYNKKPLHTTIKDFHNMRFRYHQLETAIRRDPAGRASSVQKEIAFLLARKNAMMVLTNALEKGLVPERIIHNDTKLNNLLFDAKTGAVLCLIDLDTVMPGTVLFDTGDMIRTACTTAEEDAPEDTVAFNTEFYAALIEGYVSSASSFLTEYEKSLIPVSGKVLTTIMAVRFLTDYLNGDVYYRITRPQHNLDRSRNQIALLKCMEKIIPDF
ncbi:phosphotransferase enzyme family protein [Treponema phagedenis]|uniref:phosphotransferase enzyme family protein n=1 Tax=Treponema phagedenis TaxID=162 RepID=UPI0001F63BCB|nr:phosphotransferase [Treponema phagedenis]EFW38235.1 hypothetical protein HMPREF9554_01262 [Treponema phagedenis F0421]TYT78889.1 phosphotransferase [Treponema phagedenis]